MRRDEVGNLVVGTNVQKRQTAPEAGRAGRFFRWRVARAVTWLMVLAGATALLSACCVDKEIGAMPPAVLLVEQPAANGYYDEGPAAQISAAFPETETPCESFPGMSVKTRLDIYRYDYYDACDNPRFQLFWGGIEGGYAGEGQALVGRGLCPPIDGYRCYGFGYEQTLYDSESRVEWEIRLYSRDGFPADVDISEREEIYNPGVPGDRPPVVALVRMISNDPDAIDLPWNVPADDDGLYRCGNLFHGQYSEDTTTRYWW